MSDQSTGGIASFGEEPEHEFGNDPGAWNDTEHATPKVPGQMTVAEQDVARKEFRRLAEADESETLPSVGTPIIVYPRPGMRRMGLAGFPGFVHRRHEEMGKIDVIVFFDVDDMMRMERLTRRTAENTEMVWDYPDTAKIVEPYEPSRINRLTDDLIALRTMLMGDYETPPISLFEIFAGMEKRLQAVETEIATLKKK